MGDGIWDIAPDHFIEQREQVKMERNPLFKFLNENSSYCEGNTMSLSVIRERFGVWMGVPVRGLDNGTFGQVDERYVVENVKVCKGCGSRHVKGCCQAYTRLGRASQTTVKNFRLNE